MLNNKADNYENFSNYKFLPSKTVCVLAYCRSIDIWERVLKSKYYDFYKCFELA